MRSSPRVSLCPSQILIIINSNPPTLLSLLLFPQLASFSLRIWQQARKNKWEFCKVTKSQLGSREAVMSFGQMTDLQTTFVSHKSSWPESQRAICRTTCLLKWYHTGLTLLPPDPIKNPDITASTQFHPNSACPGSGQLHLLNLPFFQSLEQRRPIEI